ncbi:aspartate--tRNA ligase [Govanella unica]|uniref:Aspartate--tRNA(Asp/Asn) ligase n=1 Tax=Govanella unica TaxID=2975056 RepID=A0A9X3TZ03_9PROT|nr:aspartate--tRNA ligase [Govania unica]MDA5194381.1 aspartate--tRNA ligase [Govania unica]
MHRYRSHTCNDLNRANVGETARISGWVHRKRDHGNLLFIDLRDHYGLTQVVMDSESPAFKLAESLRTESVITVTGKVVARSADTINPNLPTGEIELQAAEVEVQGAAQELPMPVFGDNEYPEEIRLKYRFLDLRRERLHKNIVLRSKVISSIRTRMVDQGFLEYQTPILTASSPEGARDFLVPSRIHPGKFYALPQAPQQFKQLLMVAGFDRYFQIAPCFRDEDARADRSPGEFYQLDFEMSFVTQEDVFAAIEPVLAGIFEEFSSKEISKPPFRRIPFRESMLKYGNDKPDLRNPILISDVTEVFRGSDFGIFAKAVDAGAVVRAIPAPGAGAHARSFFDKMNDWARAAGYAGLGYAIFKDGEVKGPIASKLDASRIAKLQELTGVKDGDGVFFACGKEADAAKLAGEARTRVGTDLDLIDQNRFEFCWIVDFPMYEYNEQDKKIDFSHNPFSMPQGGMEALLEKDPLDILAYQYDIVCNGIELSSGAIRNHRPDIMLKAFEIAGYSNDEVEEKFSGMLNAFRYGAPPHGGSAPGIDRMVMLIADEPNIREVILFPMNQQAQDLMMGAPGEVTPKQLRELNLRVVLPDPKK